MPTAPDALTAFLLTHPGHVPKDEAEGEAARVRNEAVTDALDRLCLVRHPDAPEAFVCTRAVRHDGDHASGRHGLVFARWSSTPIPIEIERQKTKDEPSVPSPFHGS